MAPLHAGPQAGQHSPRSLFEEERWNEEEEGEEASERCLCIINVGQIGWTCAVTGLSLSNVSPLSVGC